MTIDIFKTCASAFIAYESAKEGLDARMPEYDMALAEFQSDIRDVLETCGALDLAGQDDEKLAQELYNNSVTSVLTTPRWWHEVLGAVLSKVILGPACMIEIAGAMASESTLRHIEGIVSLLENEVELRRRAWVACIHRAMFKKSRRDGTLGPPA